MAHTCNTNTWEVDIGDHEFKFSLCYMKPCLKKKKKIGNSASRIHCLPTVSSWERYCLSDSQHKQSLSLQRVCLSTRVLAYLAQGHGFNLQCYKESV